MDLKLTDNGTDFLSRSEGNRERLNVTHIVFGSDYNYKVEGYQTSLRGAITDKRLIDSLTLSGDILTVKILLDENTAFEYGEVALVTADSLLLAVGTYKERQVKERGTSVELTYTLQNAKLNDALTRSSSRSFQLAPTRVDFDDAKLQLQAVASSKDNFGVLTTNETGNTLIELMAGVVDHNSYMAESAFQETLPQTAKLDSSIYAIQVMLKNRMSRNRPASVNVRLTRDPNLPIDQVPKYSKFNIDGTLLFNRAAIIWKARQTTQDVILYEGECFGYTFDGNSQDHQFWKANHTEFSVSDNDVSVLIDNTEIPVVTDGMWNYHSLPAVQDFTYNDGSLVLSFGTSVYGSRPLAGQKVKVAYAVTNGSRGNRSGFVGKEGTLSNSVYTVKAVALSELTGGGDAPSASSYANFGGDLFGAQYGAVTPAQYRALARTYPGVKDAIVLAQRDLAPTDKDWFNVGKIILLTDSQWSAANVQEFEKWFRKRTWYGMRWIITTGDNNTEPKQRTVDVTARIFCKPSADLPAVQRAAENAVRDLFTPRFGILARPVYRTDIIDALRSVHPTYIDYLVLETPTTDISMYLTAPVVGEAEVLEGQGKLPIGLYRWAVAAKDEQGESKISYWDVQINKPNSAVKFTWQPSTSAIGYRVYGRSPGDTSNMGLLFETADTLTWTDTGEVKGNNVKPPSINTSGVHYGVPGVINVIVEYSDRVALEETGYGVS